MLLPLLLLTALSLHLSSASSSVPEAATDGGWIHQRMLDQSAAGAAMAAPSATANGEFANRQRRTELTEITVPAQIAKRSHVRLCGRQLIQAIRVACNSREGSRRRKRSSHATGAALRPVYGFLGIRTAAPVSSSSSSPAVDFPSPASMSGIQSIEWPPLDDNVQLRPSPAMQAMIDRDNAAIRPMNKRGPTDQCCAKPCTLAHLVTYCDDD